jgi:23S rRNA (pseudouridine1915-N3)-methyltransferase
VQIYLISIGQKMPGWVKQGYEEYAKRMPRECQLIVKEIAAGKRGKNSDVSRIVRDEGERMLTAIPKPSRAFSGRY